MTPWVQCLDGVWDFRFFSQAESAFAAIGTPDLRNPQGKIQVPGVWTMQGWDHPWYTNVIMPFPHKPPRVPDHNPTGLYHKRVSIPENWRGRRVVLRLGAAESCAYVYLNGSFIGMTKDSRLAAEFELPDAQPGDHSLEILVLRWSDGSFIEDQDQWWMGGIHRSVYLYSTDRVYLQDVFVSGDFNADQATGLLTLQVSLQGSAAASRPELEQRPQSSLDPWPGGPEARSLEPGWKLVAQISRNPVYTVRDPEEPAMMPLLTRLISGEYRASGHQIRAVVPMDGIEPWSSEQPNRYLVTLSLLDPRGRVVECTALNTGFRSVRVRDRQLLINGKAVLMKGVNRHEHHPRLGKTVPREDMIRDIRLLKQNNFNAVRTSHYPNTEEWYELCDRYGIYLVDEANIESHHYYDQLCREPDWAAAFLDRAVRMVQRDKNHPSIILWSLGNESGDGPHHRAMAAWIRSYDPSRPIQYEGSVRQEWGQGPFDFSRGRDVTEIICPMYPTIAEIIQWAQHPPQGEHRPLIMCEFSHAMGNSNGSFADYWKAVKAYPGLQGGFIWDWIDQGIEVDGPGRTILGVAAYKPGHPSLGTEASEQGRSPTRHYAYGGDFGDSPNDLSFCLNGIVWPDGTPHPAMDEIKSCFQPLDIQIIHRPQASPAPLECRITSRYDFVPTKNLGLELSALLDATPLGTSLQPLPSLTPGQSLAVCPDLPQPLALALKETLAPGSPGIRGELVVTARIVTLQDEEWAPRGHVIAQNQTSHGRWQGLESQENRNISDSGDARYSAPPGDAPSRIPAGAPGVNSPDAPGTTLPPVWPLLGLPCPVIWRAPTENDTFKAIPDGQPAALADWLAWGLDTALAESAPPQEPSPEHLGSGPWNYQTTVAGVDVVLTTQPLSRGFRLHAVFTVPPDRPRLPRLGIHLLLSPEFRHATWYGRGPGEGYPDRRQSTLLGVYRSSVQDMYQPYIVPQEHGHLQDLRWLELSTGPGTPSSAGPGGSLGSTGSFGSSGPAGSLGSADPAGSFGPTRPGGSLDSTGSVGSSGPGGSFGSAGRAEGETPARSGSGRRILVSRAWESPQNSENSQEGFSANISLFSLRDLTEARHTWDLPALGPDAPVHLILDAAHRGLGTATCGPDVLPEYEIAPGIHRLDVDIILDDAAPEE